MTRAEILSKVGRALNKSATLDALTKARLLDHVNNAHRRILSSPGCQGLRRRQLQFTSVSGQARYAFNNGENIKHLRDLTNNFELSQRSLGTYREYNADPAQSPGNPDGFIQYGYEPVMLQPNVSNPAGTTLFVMSTVAGDVTQTVYVEQGTRTFSVALNGLTPVSLGPSWSYLDKFFISAPATGQVHLRADTGTGMLLSAIGVSATSEQWLAIYLEPTPTQALTYAIDIEYLITDLAQDTEVPNLPSDFHDLLETGAIIDELAHLDDDRLVVFQRNYDRRLGELKLKLARQGTDGASRGRNSRLGPWAPNTSW
jgi:hypothetical protein